MEFNQQNIYDYNLFFSLNFFNYLCLTINYFFLNLSLEYYFKIMIIFTKFFHLEQFSY